MTSYRLDVRRNARSYCSSAAFALLIAAGIARAGDGDPDPTFSGDGIAFATWAGGAIEDVHLAPGAGGAIFLGGSFNRNDSDDRDLAIAKLHADGSLDTTFGFLGYRTVGFDYVVDGSDALRAIFPLASGKIMLLGNAEVNGTIPAQAPPAMIRLTANGSIDTSFANSGRRVFPELSSPWPNPSLYMRATARQADGKFLFGGYCLNCPDTYRVVVLRVDGEGVMDASFGNSGWSSQPLPLQPRLDLMHVDAQGRIVIAGGTLDGGTSTPLIVRLTPTGELDTTFGGGDGYVRVSQLPNTQDGGWAVTALAVRNDGSMILGVSNYTPIDVDRTGLVRLDENGVFDGGFGVVGLLNLTREQGSRIQALALQDDGRILAAGWVSHAGSGLDFLIARAHADGTLDAGFGADGLLRVAMAPGSGDAAEAMLLVSGKPLIAGVVPADGVVHAGLLRLESELIFANGFE